MPGADALDSRRNDWRVSDLEKEDEDQGQIYFSDDGQLYQPLDPNVFTGPDDALNESDPSRPMSGTLPGDLVGSYDYLRRPGYAEEFEPRMFPGPKVPKRPVIGFEAPPDEPSPTFAYPKRRSVIRRYELAKWGGTAEASGFGSDRLNPGEELRPGQSLQAGGYVLTMQGDGNVVLYKGRQPLWNSATQNRGAVRALLQKDGNFVVYNARGQALFNTGTQRRPGAILVLQRDANLVVTDPRTGAVFWNSGTWGGVPARDQSEKGLLSKIGGAVVSAAAPLAKPLGGLITSPLTLAKDIATGRNVLGALKDTVKRDLSNVKDVGPYAQAVVSMVPGVGSGVNAAIAAGNAIAHGAPITDIAAQAVRGALPGGPLAGQAFDTAFKVVKGENVTAAVLEAARNQMPSDLAKRAFDTGLALAKGADLQKTLAAQGADIAKGKAMSILGDAVEALSPVRSLPMSNVGPKFMGGLADQAISMVPKDVKRVGQALLANPNLRGLPVEVLAKRMGVSSEAARDAMASLVSTVQKVGRPSIDHMTVAREAARRISPDMNFDQAMSRLGSMVGPMRFSPNAVARRARPIVLSWLRHGQGFVPHLGEAKGLDSSGLAYIVEAGDTMSKIAAKLTGSGSRWPELARANPKVTDPSKIYPGQRLNLPVSWQTAPKVATAPVPLTTTQTPTTNPATFPIMSAPAAASVVAGQMPTISQMARSSGAPVKAWQGILIRDGVAPAGSDDGIFGPNTTTRTKTWQSQHGLTADGVVGPKTWAAALATVPQVTTAPAAMPTATISTPLGQVPLPAAIPGIVPTMATIPELPGAAPLAAPIATTFPALPPAPTGAPMPAMTPVVQTTMTPEGPVTATTVGPMTTVTQPPITEAPPVKAAAVSAAPSGLLPVAFGLGVLLLMGQGSRGKLF